MLGREWGGIEVLVAFLPRVPGPREALVCFAPVGNTLLGPLVSNASSPSPPLILPVGPRAEGLPFAALPRESNRWQLESRRQRPQSSLPPHFPLPRLQRLSVCLWVESLWAHPCPRPLPNVADAEQQL